MQKLLNYFSVRVLYSMVYSLYRSYRIVPHHEDYRQLAQGLHPKGAYLLVCWHEHLVGVTMAQKGQPLRPLASRSSTGRMAGYILSKFGFTPVYGSQKRNGKDKGGKEARQHLVELCAEGIASAYTVDGSIGPRRRVKPGVIDLARRSGASILPAAAVANKQWVFATWDRLKLPKPFARIVVAYGEPITVPPNLTPEEFDSYLIRTAQAINAAEHKASEHLGILLGKKIKPSEESLELALEAAPSER